MLLFVASSECSRRCKQGNREQKHVGNNQTFALEGLLLLLLVTLTFHAVSCLGFQFLVSRWCHGESWRQDHRGLVAAGASTGKTG